MASALALPLCSRTKSSRNLQYRSWYAADFSNATTSTLVGSSCRTT